ncbi:stalk domain-containing protein [Chengkuizengella marina]|uniref:Copper amine oxidase N-terminal domain-containing protein n=1 Tax=Chengkuizengella marina TaxID=2507566 RepID=A0A6N9PZV3_9BACL|nr:stalk domain-containing protein [Chengkuizengella marina]NBI29029.1 copper amine oxidase N-terminal domain-containing protein [Chengkuizengella marina]
MKFKRTFLLIIGLSVLGAATVAADSKIKQYSGKEISVEVNGQLLSKPALNIEGTTMLPLRDIANKLHAMVEYDKDTDTVSIYKPNVQVSLLTRLKDGSLGTFGTVPKNDENEFFIFTQIDTLLKDIDSLKYEIVDPFGTIVHKYTEPDLTEQNENMWLYTPNIKFTAKITGEYTVNVYMKLSANNEFSLVGQKVFTAE